MVSSWSNDQSLTDTSVTECLMLKKQHGVLRSKNECVSSRKTLQPDEWQFFGLHENYSFREDIRRSTSCLEMKVNGFQIL